MHFAIFAFFVAKIKLRHLGYISRRGAERQSSQRLSHYLSICFHQLGEITFRDSSCYVFLFRRISELSLRSPPLCASA